MSTEHKNANMSLITLKFTPFLILFIILIPISESHVLCIRCIPDFLIAEWNGFSKLSDFVKEALLADEEIEELPVEDNELSKKVEKIEERLAELEQSLARFPKCLIDEDPSRKTQKCDIGSDSYSHTCTGRCSMPKAVAQNTEILEKIIEKPFCVTSNVINFKSETNVNINDKSLPISPDYVQINLTVYQFKFIVVLVFLLLIAGLVFLFYQKIRALENKTVTLDEQIVSGRQSAANSTIERVTSQDEETVSYNADDSDEGSDSETRDTVVTNNADGYEERSDSENRATVPSINTDVSTKGFDSESRVTEENTTIIEDWTPEKVYNNLKRISEIAAKEYPRNKNVKYLSDEFLTQIANFIAEQGCFRNFEKYLTPEELLQHARHHRRLLKLHEFREKERKVHVIVNVDGQQIQTADLESSSSI